MDEKFDRKSGTVFLDQCRIVVAAAHGADSAAKQAADGQAGELRIGAVTTAFTDPLPQTLHAFTRSHPDVDVRVRAVDTQVAVELLQRRELDIVLIRQLAAPRDCNRVVLKQESFVLVVPAGWDLPPALECELALSADLPWIWLPRSISPDYHDQVAASCRTAGLFHTRNTWPHRSRANSPWSRADWASYWSPKVRPSEANAVA